MGHIQYDKQYNLIPYISQNKKSSRIAPRQSQNDATESPPTYVNK